MASFSFGAGNAAKLLRIPLYAGGRLVTAVVPRSRDQWVFGCAVGIADGALALWEQSRGERAVWLVANERERLDAAARGIPTVPKHSLIGFWRTARARVIVVTHGFGDVNRYAVSGAYVVQLWHGIPLKRIGLDSPETTRMGRIPGLSRLVATLYRRTQQQISLLPAASHLVRGRLESAFALPDDRVRVTGEPRVDVLSQGTAGERRAEARRRLSRLWDLPDRHERIVLYAPTWRDGAPDPAVPTRAQWEALVQVLEQNDAVLAIRSHPLGAGDYTPPFATDRVRSLGSALVADVTPLLPGIDVLITDYSSLAFDASLVPVPVVYLAPDAVEYGERRGFYGTYLEVAGDEPAQTWDAAADDLASLLSDPSAYELRVERARALSEHVHAFHDGKNTERVYATIRAGLDGHAQGGGPR